MIIGTFLITVLSDYPQQVLWSTSLVKKTYRCFAFYSCGFYSFPPVCYHRLARKYLSIRSFLCFQRMFESHFLRYTAFSTFHTAHTLLPSHFFTCCPISRITASFRLVIIGWTVRCKLGFLFALSLFKINCTSWTNAQTHSLWSGLRSRGVNVRLLNITCMKFGCQRFCSN